MKPTTCLASALLAVLPLLAHAEPPSDASLDRLFTAMDIRNVLEGSRARMQESIHQMSAQAFAAAGAAPTPEQQRLLDDGFRRSAELVAQEFTWDKMEPDMRGVYRQTLDQAEVDGMIGFFESPAGRAYVAKLPALTQQSLVVTQRRMATLMPRIVEIMKQSVEEAKKTP